MAFAHAYDIQLVIILVSMHRQGQVLRLALKGGRRPGRAVAARGAMGDERTVAVGERRLPFDPRPDPRPGAVGLMRESTASDATPALQDSLARDGYLLLRGALPAEAVAAARRAIVSGLVAHGWQFADEEHLVLSDDHPCPCPWSAQGGSSAVGQPFGGAALQAVMQSPAVLRVAEGEEIFDIFQRIFSEPASTLDMKWLRAMSPVPKDSEPSGGFHCDNVFMGRGSKQLTTAWVPFADVSVELGGLVALQGSSSLPGFQKLRETYGVVDVDRCDIKGAGPGGDPLLLASLDPAARWVTSDFKVGDLVLFGMHTLHGGIRNETDRQLRLSADLRFQPARERRDERWIGHPPPMHERSRGLSVRISLLCVASLERFR
jgi:hypothetical protein